VKNVSQSKRLFNEQVTRSHSWLAFIIPKNQKKAIPNRLGDCVLSKTNTAGILF